MGNSITEALELDSAGRRVLVAMHDGVHPAVKTRMAYDSYGKLIRVERIANGPEGVNEPRRWWQAARARISLEAKNTIVSTAEYDAQSRVKRIIIFDGTYVEIKYDAAGRVVRVHDQNGSAIETQWNTESRQLEATALDTSVAAPMRVTTRYELDAYGRISGERAATGAVTHYGYDAETGDMSNSIDAINRRTDYAYDSEGRLANIKVSNKGQEIRTLSQRYQASDEFIIAGNGASTRQSYDDFGRLRSITSPDSGLQLAEYDPAGRPTVITDGNQNGITLRYNTAGHMVERVTTGKRSDGTPDTRRSVYRYEGARLKSVINAYQRTEFSHNTSSRVVEQIDVLTPTAESPKDEAPRLLRFVKRYSYDGLGRVQSQTLASGEKLVFSYNKSGTVEKITLHSLDGRAVQPIVGDIEVQRFGGLVGFTH